jgi:hypothetical protein
MLCFHWNIVIIYVIKHKWMITFKLSILVFGLKIEPRIGSLSANPLTLYLYYPLRIQTSQGSGFRPMLNVITGVPF